MSKDDGSIISYMGGLDDPGYQESLDRFSHSIDQQVISLQLDLGVDVAQLVQKGHIFGGNGAELSCVLVQDGTIQQTYEGRMILLTGNVSEPQYGFPDQPVGYITCSIEGALSEEAGALLSASASISVTTFPDVATDGKEVHEGKPYPIVFGSPGKYKTSSGLNKTTSGSPAYIVDINTSTGKATKLLIAGHHVNASTVIVFDSRSYASFSVTNTTDGLNQPVALVTISGTDIDRTEREFWIGWNNGSGIKNPWSTNDDLTGLGDIMRWAMSYSSLPVDYGSFAASADYLNQFKLDGYISDPSTSVWEWVSSIASTFPVTIRRGSSGLYPIIHDVRASPDIGLKVFESPEFQQLSHVQVEGKLEDIFNSIRLGYALRAKESSPKIYAVIGTKATGDPSSFSTTTTRQSISKYGIRYRSFNNPYVYDRSTAQKIVRYMADVEALPSRTIDYRAAPRYASISLGDIVTLTDSSLYFTDQACIVTRKAWDTDSWIFTLLIDTIPDRDDRTF
jgi:hypothetical protein|tara:strand:+ start:1305 stop:2828 length:1524 start_codon:yes stop_codon:yes gene_type:complete